MTQSLRIGLIGAGYVGRTVHIPSWLRVPEATIVALCDTDPAALGRAAALVPGAAVFSDHRALLAHGVDAISICTPNMTHAPIARDVLDSGVHAFVEKPLAVNPQDVRALGAVADARGLVLTVRHQLRTDPSAQAARARVAALGPLTHIRARALRRDRIPTTSGLTNAAQAGGGAALDLGVHVLDLALWLAGFPRAVRVQGQASGHYGRGHVPGYVNAWGEWDRLGFSVEDTASATVALHGGATLSLECAWAGDFTAEQSGTWCELEGPAGRVRWDAPPPHTRGPDTPPPDFTAFAHACRFGSPSPVPWHEALASLEILEAFYRSVREERVAAVGPT